LLRGSLEASLLAEASGSEVEEKLVLYRLALEQRLLKDDYLRQLVYSVAAWVDFADDGGGGV
jgi:hypothetical protein